MDYGDDYKLLLKVIERMAQEWENYRVDDISADAEKIDLLLEIEARAADENGKLTPAKLRAQCPQFVSLFRAVCLRELKEPMNYGTSNP